MNIVSGSHERSHHFWNERLLPSIRSRFGELAVDHAEEGNIRLLLQPCIVYIIQRLQVRPYSCGLLILRAHASIYFCFEPQRQIEALAVDTLTMRVRCMRKSRL